MTDEHALPAPHVELTPPGSFYYRRDGSPQQGAVIVDDPLVAYTVLQDQWGGLQQVSTAFLGVDASLGMAPTPELWETVIRGGRWHGAQYRYPTEAEAVSAHGQLVAALAEHMVADGRVGDPPAAPTVEEPVPDSQPEDVQEAADQGVADVEALNA